MKKLVSTKSKKPTTPFLRIKEKLTQVTSYIR